MGYVLVHSGSEHKISTRRDRHQNRQLRLAIQMSIALGIVVALGSTLSAHYSLGFTPHETLKEAQLREFREAKDKAMQKEMDEELEAEMRAWQKTEEKRSQQPIKQAN